MRGSAMKDSVRKLQRWLLLVVSFLALGLGEEWVTSLLRGAGWSRWLKALIIMLVVGLAYALAAEVLAPYLHRSVRKMHGAVRPGHGLLAGMIGAVLLLVAVYLGYYFTFT